MRGVEVILPGGLPENGYVERRACFRPITGKTELALVELERSAATPFYVSSVLLLVLESIGGRKVDAACVNSLCMADRQFLMLRLAALLGGEQVWLQASCGHCQALFDIEIRRCELPVKPAGSEFPSARLDIRGEEVEVCVPTALAQMEMAEMSDQDALRHLLQRCISKVNGTPPDATWAGELSDEDIAAIDQALEELSPAVCNELSVICPECNTAQSASLNHYDLAGVGSSSLYDEIHILAMHYHWSEEEILNMPRARRCRYLDLINRSKGAVGQVQ